MPTKDGGVLNSKVGSVHIDRAGIRFAVIFVKCTALNDKSSLPYEDCPTVPVGTIGTEVAVGDGDLCSYFLISGSVIKETSVNSAAKISRVFVRAGKNSGSKSS